MFTTKSYPIVNEATKWVTNIHLYAITTQGSTHQTTLLEKLQNQLGYILPAALQPFHLPHLVLHLTKIVFSSAPSFTKFSKFMLKDRIPQQVRNANGNQVTTDQLSSVWVDQIDEVTDEIKTFFIFISSFNTTN